MYIMYVDESGDIGINNSHTKYFFLSAIIVHESFWNQALDDLVVFRKFLRTNKGLKMNEEIHCSDFISKPGDLANRISINERVNIIKLCIKWIQSRTYLKVFSVKIDKSKCTSKEEVFVKAWTSLIQRFEDTMKHGNFKDIATNFDFGDLMDDGKTKYYIDLYLKEKDFGMIVNDNTDNKKLRDISRKMRRYNPIPNNRSFYADGSRNMPIKRIVEDPVNRDSRDSFFLQLCDVVAYLAYQNYTPNSRAKKKGLHNYYHQLGSSILTVATKNNKLGIVEI